MYAVRGMQLRVQAGRCPLHTLTLPPPLLRPAAYIYQEDAFFSRLTVRETLQFALALRAGASLSL